MTQTAQTQASSGPMEQLWSKNLSMALEGAQATMTHGKKLMESTFEMANGLAKENLKLGNDVYTRFTDATNHLNELLREQTSLINRFSEDPMGITQRAISGYLEYSRKSLESGAEILKSQVALVNNTWGHLERVSQTMRESYVEYSDRVQGIVESKMKKA